MVKRPQPQTAHATHHRQAHAKPAHAAHAKPATPFQCEDTLYQVFSKHTGPGGAQVELARLDMDNEVYEPVAVYNNNTDSSFIDKSEDKLQTVNAVSWWVDESGGNHMYGVDNRDGERSLAELYPDGDFKRVAKLPVPGSGKNYYVGETIGDDVNKMYISSGNKNLFVVDLTEIAATPDADLPKDLTGQGFAMERISGEKIHDVCNYKGDLYSVTKGGKLQKMKVDTDPPTVEAAVDIGLPGGVAYGACWAFDGNTQLYASSNDGAGLYKIDPENATSENVMATQPTNSNDGTACYDAPRPPALEVCSDNYKEDADCAGAWVLKSPLPTGACPGEGCDDVECCDGPVVDDDVVDDDVVDDDVVDDDVVDDDDDAGPCSDSIDFNFYIPVSVKTLASVHCT
eukprot:32434_1